MKTDIQGCSTCPKGQERYEHYRNGNGFDRLQYDFRTNDDRLFSCIAKTLEDARKRRDAWLASEERMDRMAGMT